MVSICWVAEEMSEKFGLEERRFEKGFEEGVA